MRKVPFLRLCLSLIFGIIINGFFPGYLMMKIIALISSVFFLIISFIYTRIHKKYFLLYGNFLILTILCLGVFADEINHLKYDKSHYAHVVNENPAGFSIKIIENRSSVDKFKYIVEVGKFQQDSVAYKVSGLLLVHSKEEFELGDKLFFESTVQPFQKSKNQYCFDYADFQKRKKIHYQSFPTKIQKLGSDKNWSQNLRLSFVKRIESLAVSQKTRAILLAMLVGEKGNLNELENIFRATGTSHVLAISGLHVGIIATILHFLLAFLPTRFTWLKNALVIIGVWIFCVISGMAPSTLRASLMVTSFLIGMSFKIKGFGFNFCFLSGFIMLLANPNLLFDVGFQFSYLAILGILYFYEPLYKVLTLKGLKDVLWKMSVLSLAAQITLTPLSLYYFHEFPLLFLPASIVAIPATFLIITVSIITLLVDHFGILAFIEALLNWFVELFLGFLEILSEIDGSVVKNLWPNSFELALYYICLFSISSFFIESKRKAILLFLLSFIVLLLSQFYFNSELNKPTLTVYADEKQIMIDVFQSGNLFGYQLDESSHKKLQWNRQGLIQKFKIYHIENHLLSKEENQLLTIGQYSIYLLNDASQLKPSERVDLLIVNDHINVFTQLPTADTYMDFKSNYHIDYPFLRNEQFLTNLPIRTSNLLSI